MAGHETIARLKERGRGPSKPRLHAGAPPPQQASNLAGRAQARKGVARGAGPPEVARGCRGPESEVKKEVKDLRGKQQKGVQGPPKVALGCRGPKG